MSNLYFKKTDVIRSLFDYLEGHRTMGECIDAVKCVDIDNIISLLEEGKIAAAIKILKVSDT